MMKMKIYKASCHVELDYLLTGSVLMGTVRTTWNGVRTDLNIEADESLDKIVALVRNAKGGCFAENLVVQEVPLHSSVTFEGQTIDMRERE